MNTRSFAFFFVCIFCAKHGWCGELPVRYDVVQAPEGVDPSQVMTKTDAGLQLGFSPRTPAGQRDKRRVGIWNVTTGQVSHWTIPDEYAWAQSLHATGDDLMMLLGGKSKTHQRRWTVWYAMQNEGRDLQALPDEGWQLAMPSRCLPDGRVIGSLKRSLEKGEWIAALWDTEGKPMTFEHRRYRGIQLVDAVGPYVVGTLSPKKIGAPLQGFCWTEDKGIVEVPLAEGCSWMRAVKVDATGRVLLNAKFYEEHESRRVERMRPYTWSAEDGLEPISIPDHWSAKVLDINSSGHVLLGFYNFDVAKQTGVRPKGEAHLAVTTLDADEVMVIPRVYDSRFSERGGSLSESGAIRIRAARYEHRDVGGKGWTDHRGAVLLPVYE